MSFYISIIFIHAYTNWFLKDPIPFIMRCVSNKIVNFLFLKIIYWNLGFHLVQWQAKILWNNSSLQQQLKILLDCVCWGGSNASDTDQDLENWVYLTIGTVFLLHSTTDLKSSPWETKTLTWDFNRISAWGKWQRLGFTGHHGEKI